MATIRKSRIRPHIYLLEFPSQYELASTFLRFQEHYESPRFRGRVFSLEEYMDWYAGKYGAFTYFEDWAGFNVPSSVLTPFYEGRFNPLQEKEKKLLRLFRGTATPFYAIGKVAGDDDPRTLEHELAHAIYYLDPLYRREVRRALKDYDLRAEKKRLLEIGYCRQVLEDEVHAYVLTDRGATGSRRSPHLAPLRRRLRELFVGAVGEGLPTGIR